MDRRTRESRAARHHRLVHGGAVHSFPPERGQKRGVHVEHLVFVPAAQLGGDQAQVPGQAHVRDSEFFERVDERVGVQPLVPLPLLLGRGIPQRGQAVVARPRHAPAVGRVAHDDRHLGVDAAVQHRRVQRAHVGPAAAHEDRHPRGAGVARRRRARSGSAPVLRRARAFRREARARPRARRGSARHRRRRRARKRGVL